MKQKKQISYKYLLNKGVTLIKNLIKFLIIRNKRITSSKKTSRKRIEITNFLNL